MTAMDSIMSAWPTCRPILTGYGGKAKLQELVKQVGDEGNPMAQVND